jgi:hypothetical protein
MQPKFERHIYLIFSLFKEDNCQKSYQDQIRIWPVFSAKISPYKISALYIHPYISLRVETENFLFFSMLKKDSYVKNHRTLTKFELDFRIPYDFYDTYIQTKTREGQLCQKSLDHDQPAFK